MEIKRAEIKTQIGTVSKLFFGIKRYFEISVFEISRVGPEVMKLFSSSNQLSMKFFLLINVKMPTNVGILTFMSRKNSILGVS